MQANERQIIREEQIWILIHVDCLYLYIQLPYLFSSRTPSKNWEKKTKINSKNCFSSVMPPDQHNNTPRDDIKPWSLLLEGFAEPSCPSAPKLHPYNLNCHTLDRTHKAYVELVWVTKNTTTVWFCSWCGWSSAGTMLEIYIGRVRHRWRWLL